MTSLSSLSSLARPLWEEVASAAGVPLGKRTVVELSILNQRQNHQGSALPYTSTGGKIIHSDVYEVRFKKAFSISNGSRCLCAYIQVN